MPLALDKQIDLGVEGEQDVLLTVPPFELSALIKNLVDNAIRHTPAEGKVDLVILPQSDYVTLQIRDHGPGIPLKERERVFDPFYRVLGQEQDGSGLGLSIVKTLATRMAASVELDWTDKTGRQGLTVSVTIPLHKEGNEP